MLFQRILYVAISFQTFLRLPELQRCAVILKDVLGHSVDEIASIAGCSATAAKSALQRGRAALRLLVQLPEDTRLPLMSDKDSRPCWSSTAPAQWKDLRILS